MTKMTKHEVTMHQTAIPSGVGPVFEADSGERLSLTGANHEDMGWPGIIHITVEEGSISEPEADAPREIGSLQILRDALGDETVDHYLNVLGLINRDQEAKALLSAVDTIKKTGGAVEINGVRIEPCDTYGQTDTTREVEALRRHVASMVRARELGPIVVSRDEMPCMDVRGLDMVHADVTNTDFIFFLEAGTYEPQIDPTDIVAESRPEPHGDFERTAAIAIRNLRSIVEDENADPDARIRAARLILDHS